MPNYYTLLTNIGKAQLANAQVLGQALNLSELAVGDGNGAYMAPEEQQTALKNEVWRAAINQIYVDNNNANWLVIEAVIPETTGGWTVREVGVFDDAGNLIAVGAYPETYKPQLAEGSGRDLYIRMILEISNTAQVELKIDPAIVLATRDYVDRSLKPPLHVLATAIANLQLEQLRQADRIKQMTGEY
jgi:phage-related tail fiber protein